MAPRLERGILNRKAAQDELDHPGKSRIDLVMSENKWIVYIVYIYMCIIFYEFVWYDVILYDSTW